MVRFNLNIDIRAHVTPLVFVVEYTCHPWLFTLVTCTLATG